MFSTVTTFFRRLMLAGFMLIISFVAVAQDKKVDITIGEKSSSDNVFMQPWVWVVGGAVFILLLVALLRGKKS